MDALCEIEKFDRSCVYLRVLSASIDDDERRENHLRIFTTLFIWVAMNESTSRMINVEKEVMSEINFLLKIKDTVATVPRSLFTT